MSKSYLVFRMQNILRDHLTGVAGFVFYLLALVFKSINSDKYWVKFILMSIRYSYSSAAQRSLKNKLDSDSLNFSDYLSNIAPASDALRRAIILSPPVIEGDRFQKGVMLLSFTHTFSFFLKHPQWDNLNKFYAFVLEPSWAGYADTDILAFLQKAEDCIVQASEIKDRAFINSTFPHIPCLDTGASNWVDYARFKASDDQDKVYDAIYIANMNPIKRVYAAIDAVNEIIKFKNNYKMRIICAGWGAGKISDFFSYIEGRGLQKNIILSGGMPQIKLSDEIKKAKCSILLSMKEGSNRTLFESMFVNVPVICLIENIGVNKSYINCQTGLLISQKMLPESLIFMAENFDRYNPRRWALEHISPEVTTTLLSDVIDSWFKGRVNSKLYVKVNSPEVNYQNGKQSGFEVSDLLDDSRSDEFRNISVNFFMNSRSDFIT